MINEKKTILLVEDDQFISQMYKTKLEGEGYNVNTAFNGEEAVMQIGKNKPDLILLDIMMPKQNGFYVLEKIKENPAWPDIPVIMLSNMAEFQDINKAIEMGARDYIVKSQHSIDEVAAKVKKYLGS